ncbi:MAG: PAS domain S-box protein [Verrucomicrobia bacterium]|nr:PAS domain S-box protein [Verrucomicrobiota bacterium]
MAPGRNRALIAAILLLLGAAVYLTIDLNRSGRREVLAQLSALQSLLAHQVIHEVTSFLQESTKDLLAVAAMPSVQRREVEQGLADIQTYFENVTHPWPLGLLVLDQTGAVTFSTSNSVSFATNYAETPFFEWAKGKGNRLKVFTSAWAQMPSRQTNQRTSGRFLLATPLYRDVPEPPPLRPIRVWSGVLVMTVDLESILAEHLKLWSQNESHRIWIMDRDGTVLLHSEHPEMTQENIYRVKHGCYDCHISFAYAEKILTANKPGIVEYHLKGQSKKLAAFAPMQFGNAVWTIVVNTPSATVTAFLRRSFWKTLLLVGVMVLALSLAGLILYETHGSKVRAEEVAKQWQEKHRLEEEVRRAEERYRTLFEHSPDGVVMLAPDTLLPIEFSAAAHRQLGYSREEFARLRVADYEVADAPGWTQARLEGLQREGQVSFETQHRMQTGEVRNVEVIAHGLTLGERRVFHCIYHDITERKRAEKAMEHRTAQLEALYQASLGIAAETEPATLYQTITRQAMTLFQGKAGSLWLHQPERKVLELVIILGGDASLAGVCVKRGEDVAGKVWQTGVPLIVADYPHWEGRPATIDQHTCASSMAAPIRWGDAFLGVLRVCSDSPGFFTRADASLLSLFATQAAIAVKNSGLLEQVRRDAAIKTTLLNDVNHRVKNNLLRLTELVQLEREHAPSTVSGLQASLVDLENRLRGMETVHAMLSRQQWNPLPLKELVVQVANAALGGVSAHQRIYVSTAAPPEPLWVVPEQATALALIINELTTNSLKHAFREREQGHLELRLGVENGQKSRPLVKLQYRDDGPGWPEAVLQGQRKTVGLHLIQSSVRSPLRGELTLRNEAGAVAEITFELALPA